MRLIRFSVHILYLSESCTLPAITIIMPLSHLNITVSHLPTSTSFFLASLQPLGYRYVGRTDNCVGFGPEPGDRADFWISEERKGCVSLSPLSSLHTSFYVE